MTRAHYVILFSASRSIRMLKRNRRKCMIKRDELNFVFLHRRKKANAGRAHGAGTRDKIAGEKARGGNDRSQDGKSARLVARGGHVSEPGHLTLSFTRVHFVSAFRYAYARVRPSVRSCSRSSRARSYADASLAPTMRRELSAREEKKRGKEKEKRETSRARGCERRRE